MSLTKQLLLDSMEDVMSRQMRPYEDAGLLVVGRSFMSAPNRHAIQVKLNLRILASMYPEDPKWEQAHASIGAASSLLALCNAIVAVYNMLEAAFPDHQPVAADRARWHIFNFIKVRRRLIVEMKDDDQLMAQIHVQLVDEEGEELNTNSTHACFRL